jgi:hypothetical protein
MTSTSDLSRIPARTFEQDTENLELGRQAFRQQKHAEAEATLEALLDSKYTAFRGEAAGHLKNYAALTLQRRIEHAEQE